MLMSVMMPAYNAERFVAQAVESILAQTLDDFEFIIIDDGSSDRTHEILQRYAARDARIRLVSRPNTGRGVAPTRNDLLHMARGEFLALMDADDIAVPQRLEWQLAFLRENPEVGAVGGAIIDIDEAGRELIQTDYPTDDQEIQEAMLQGKCLIANPTSMMRREIVLSVGGYREEMLHLEDLDLFLRIGERAKLANLDRVVLRYRIHPGSETHRRLEVQERYTRKAAEDAAARRGIASRYVPLEPHREVPGDRMSRFAYSLKYGWWGFNRGDRLTALHYGWRAIRTSPANRDGWKLVGCALLKKPIQRDA